MQCPIQGKSALKIEDGFLFNCEVLRKTRLEKKYTLAYMSEQVGYTASFLSQLERGLKLPSIGALRKIADCLEIPLFLLFTEQNDSVEESDTLRGYEVTRQKDRMSLPMHGLSGRYESVIPASGAGRSDGVLSAFLYRVPPGGWARESMVGHAVDETAFIVSGSMLACLQDEAMHLEAGDFIYIYAHTPHNFQNVGEDELVYLLHYPKAN